MNGVHRHSCRCAYAVGQDLRKLVSSTFHNGEECKSKLNESSRFYEEIFIRD